MRAVFVVFLLSGCAQPQVRDVPVNVSGQGCIGFTFLNYEPVAQICYRDDPFCILSNERVVVVDR